MAAVSEVVGEPDSVTGGRSCASAAQLVGIFSVASGGSLVFSDGWTEEKVLTFSSFGSVGVLLLVCLSIASLCALLLPLLLSACPSVFPSQSLPLSLYLTHTRMHTSVRRRKWFLAVLKV